LRYGGHEKQLSGGDLDTTNNRMELMAVIRALESLTRPCRVRVTTDSQYVRNGITGWIANWKARGWKRRAGPIENLELWKQLDELLGRHLVHPRWVRGHVGHPENEYANHLATRCAKDASDSGGLVESRFQDWLEALREKGRYLDYMEFQGPAERFG